MIINVLTKIIIVKDDKKHNEATQFDPIFGFFVGLLRSKNSPQQQFCVELNISIFHESILAVAQAQQFAASEQKEDFVFPNEFPQNTAHPHLIVG